MIHTMRFAEQEQHPTASDTLHTVRSFERRHLQNIKKCFFTTFKNLSTKSRYPFHFQVCILPLLLLESLDSSFLPSPLTLRAMSRFAGTKSLNGKKDLKSGLQTLRASNRLRSTGEHIEWGPLNWLGVSYFDIALNINNATG